MANQTVSTSQTLESVIAGGLLDGESITINGGAIITCTETPSVLMGNISITDGELFIDGNNISSGNQIMFIGDGASTTAKVIYCNGQGTFRTEGDWYSIGTTNGIDNQVLDLTNYYGTNPIDSIPMIQIETGRRINFDNATGITPTVGDWVYSSLDKSVRGKVHSVGVDYLVLWCITGVFIDNSSIECEKIVDNYGPLLDVSWTALANGDDIKEDDVYMEFGNSLARSIDYMTSFGTGLSGFLFSNVFQSTDLVLGGITGGFKPPSGCNVRLPNIHFASATDASYVINETSFISTNVEANLYGIETYAAGDIKLTVTNLGSVYFVDNSAHVWESNYVGGFISMGSNNCATKAIYNHCVISQDPVYACQQSSRYIFPVQDMINGAEITFCLNIQSQFNYGAIGGESAIGLNVSDCISIQAGLGTALNTNFPTTYSFEGVTDTTFSNNVSYGCDDTRMRYVLNVSGCDNFIGTNFYYSTTINEVPQVASIDSMYMTKTTNSSIIGITVLGDGIGGANMIRVSDGNYIKVRGLGSIDKPIDFGIEGGYCIYISGLGNHIDIARMWKINGSYNEFIVVPTTCKNVTVKDCGSSYDGEIQPSGADLIRFSGLNGGSGSPGSSDSWEDNYPASYGYNFHNGFQSDTEGTIACIMITPSLAANESTIVSGNPKFFKDGDLNMVLGDVIIFEMQYFAKGYTGFSGKFTTAIGSSNWFSDEFNNVDIVFQWMIDGGDWNGTWLDLRTSTNLTDINGSVGLENGIKIKYMFTATGTQNDMSMVLLDMTTTLETRKANLYPIDQNLVTTTITVIDGDTGLPINGAIVYLYATGNGGIADNTPIINKLLTNGNGQVSDSRVITSNQNVVGRVRKSTTSPLYRTSPIVGTITTDSGLDFTAIMISDE